MRIARLLPSGALLAALWLFAANAASAAASLELYGTFHSMGVVVSIAGSDDPDGDASASVEYRSGGGAYRSGYPLTRVDDTRFAGSLFWLEPGTSYDARVTLSDPDGGPLDGVTLAGAAATRAELSIPQAADTFYVSPTGSGAACSLAVPCALAEGIAQAGAGDVVSLRGGVYYEGEISLPRSGAEGAPIAIEGHPGETAILDGADPATFSWTAEGGGVYRATVNVADTHLVTAAGERLYPYPSLVDLQNLSWGIPGFYASGTTLYVRLQGDVDPSSVAMEVSRHGYAFLLDGRDFIYLSDLVFRHYGQGSFAKAIYLNDASDNLVQSCAFAINDLGIGIKRDAHRNVIQDNEFYDTTFSWTWEAVKDGSQLETGGVVFYSPTSGRGNVIRRNVFHDYFDGFTTCPEDNGPETNETDVYENLVYRAGDDGLSADGACSNVRIWGNVFHDVLVGISLAPVYEGPLYAIRNLIYRTGAGNSLAGYTGMPFKFNSGFPGSGSMYLFHNTADAVLPGNDGFQLRQGGSWELIRARNNIWAGTAEAFVNANATQPVDFDYDDLYRPGGDVFARWAGTRLYSLAELQVDTGQELHGFDLAPEFADPASGDYTLPAGSNMIDKGLLIPGINYGFTGTAPDLGAHEALPEPAAGLASLAALAPLSLLARRKRVRPPTA